MPYREVLDKVSNYICIRKCKEYPGAYTYEASLAVADMRGTKCTRELEIPTKHNGLDAY